MKTKRWYIKLTSWEYWPIWILYVPVFVQHFYLSLKAKNLFYFLKVNPAIGEGFILSDSKYKTLQLVPSEFRPKTAFIPKQSSVKAAKQIIRENQFTFPVIIKPDIGYRGLLVYVCKDEGDIRKINFNKGDYLVQQYVDYPVEVGVFYYRFPGESRGAIPSLTLKEFLCVTGDGVHTFQELVMQKPRALLQYEKLKNRFKVRWNDIIPQGEKIVLELIGNHNRGTKFINANNDIDIKLTTVFDALNRQMKGFYYGRFDIRIPSMADLKSGKNFKILEVNGVGAEPTHVYDPSYSLIKAWKDMLQLWKVAYKIAVLNHKKGEKFPVFSEAKQRYLQYRKYKKAAFAQ